jgi:hypothetical protein
VTGVIAKWTTSVTDLCASVGAEATYGGNTTEQITTMTALACRKVLLCFNPMIFQPFGLVFTSVRTESRGGSFISAAACNHGNYHQSYCKKWFYL